MNLRRPLSLFLLALLLVGTGACDRVKNHFSKEDSSTKDSSTTEGSGYTESARTSEMEDKAAEIDRQAQDLQTMEGSDQDKIDAYNKLQQEQQELNSMSESSEGGN